MVEVNEKLGKKDSYAARLVGKQWNNLAFARYSCALITFGVVYTLVSPKSVKRNASSSLQCACLSNYKHKI